MRAAGREGDAAMMPEVVLGGWYAAGPHLFGCLDHEDGGMDALRARLPSSVEMVYSDPPWGQANARYWRTYARKHAVPWREPDWNSLIARLIRLVGEIGPSVVAIEMGTRWSAALARALPQPTSIHEGMYGKPLRVNHLVVAAAADHPLHAIQPIPLRGEALTAHVFARAGRVDGIVVDPFVGRGMTARFAHRSGMICYGAELCPHRLSAVLAWLARHGCAVERIE